MFRLKGVTRLEEFCGVHIACCMFPQCPGAVTWYLPFSVRLLHHVVHVAGEHGIGNKVCIGRGQGKGEGRERYLIGWLTSGVYHQYLGMSADGPAIR